MMATREGCVAAGRRDTFAAQRGVSRFSKRLAPIEWSTFVIKAPAINPFSKLLMR